MTAIFTGLGSGLAKSSATELGSAGTLGNAATGRGGEGLSVNAATGNLVISRRDEFLVGRNLDVGVSRTYNSMAEVHDRDNNDKWMMSTARRIFGLTGTANAAGSTIKRASGDGSVVTYNWESRGGQWGYWTTDGSGSHDRIYQQTSSTWVWVDGQSRIAETYSADPYNAGEFRITKQADRDNQALVFGYSGSKLSYVRTNNNEYVRYTWSGNNLTSIKTEFVDPRSGEARTETGTYYSYSNGRLATVTIDLSPEDAGISDGHTFTISYLYDSAGRVTRMTQSDGSRTDITYSSGKVTKLTEHVGDGTTRITQFAYGTNYTNVTAPNGQVTRLDYNSATKLLTRITAPAAYTGAAKQVQTFTYDSAKNLTQSVAPDGRITKYTYDAKGNVTKVDRPIGTDVTKWYDTNNNLIKELSYGSNEASANTGSYVRYAYDSENHLRYKVTAEGHVTEYRYDSYGRLVWEGDYTKYSYAHSSSNISEAGMNTWRGGLSDKTQVDWMNYRYDARGNLTQTLNYGAATSTGGASSSGSLESYSRTYYVYDQEGRLLTRYGQNESGKEQFVYDGMGRLVASSDSAGATTSVFFDDANTRTVMQMASGLTRTMVYNKAGDLISETESSVGPMSANLAPALTSWSKSGHISRTATTAIAGQPAYLYSIAAGGTYGNTNRHTSVAAGETVKFTITIQGSGTQTRHRVGLHGNSEGWGTSKNTRTQATIINGPGRLSQDIGGLWWIDGISTTAPTTIELTRTYEVAQTARGYFYVGGSGTQTNGASVILSNPIITKTVTDASLDFSATTNNQYDKLGRLRVTQDAFDGRGVNYIIYDKAGRKVGSVDPLGRLAEYFYDTNNRLIGSTTYFNAVSTSVRDQLANPNNTLEMSAIRPSFNDTYDIREFTIYDGNGRVVQTINGEGEVMSYKYDNSARVIEVRNHFNKVTVASGWRTSSPTAPVSISNNNTKDAVTRTFYDRDGNVRGVLDGEKHLTEFVYDQSGQKTLEITYANPTTRSDWLTATFNTIRSSVGTTNVNNRYVRFVYNGRGELRFSIDSANYITQYKYNNAGKLTTTTQHINPLASNHSNWTIAGVKAALAGSNSDRSATHYYDFAGRLWRTVDPIGLDTRMYFDTAGNVIKTTAGNRTVRNWYDARGNLRFNLDAEGYLTSYLYNEGGQVTHQRRLDAKKSASDSTTIQQIAALATGGYSETRQTYDSKGRVSYSYDAVGNRTRYAYQYNGLLSYVTVGHGTSDSSQTVNYYDNAGRMTRQDRANGQSEEAITYFTYDGLGNQTQVKDGNGRIAYFTYDKRGNILTEKNGAGNEVRYEYNAFGQVVKTWDAMGVLASEHVYNKRGQITTSYDALRKATSYVYTHFGEVQKVTDPLGAETTFTYDKLGRVISTTDANQNKANSLPAGAERNAFDAAGGTETYTYDAYSNRTRMTNKLGGVTTYVYDKLGRMTSMNDANGIVTAYTYDARGNRLTVTEASGRSEARKTTNTYDRANRLTQSSVEGHNGSYATQYAYDKRGNVIRQIAPDGGKTVYFYDDLDRVTTEINALGTYTAYTYDKNGNVKTIKVYATPVSLPSTGGHEEATFKPTAPSSPVRETRFDYDGANRMILSAVKGVHNGTYNGSAWVANASDFITRYVYDANGNVVKTIDPNGGTTWAYYDAMGRKQHQVDAQNFRTTWTYDAGGNVTREIRYANATATPTSTTSVPGVSANSSLDRRTDYTYDAMGNRLSEQRFYVKYHNGSGAHSTGHPKISYTYNALGQVTKKTEAVSGNVTDYTYDVGGRMTRETRAAFTDFNGNSVRPLVDYYYDGLGNLTRTRQGGATGAAERNTYYYYKKGMLDRMTDAGGLTRYYKYDNAGRETETYYTRANYYNASRTEGVKRTYDKLDRVVSEFQGTRASNGVWTAISPTVTTTYNAFGEVASIKAGSGAVQTNKYDDAGRLWATNSGDGVWKFFGYDKNGNQTIAITSAGASFGASTTFQNAFDQINNANVNATYTIYDKRGSALKVYETDRDISSTAVNQTLVTERRYNAFGEVSYEKDANGGDIYYDYTTMGKVWRVRNPSVSIQNENGSTATVRPTEYFYHDLGGRLTASRDANGNLTRMNLLNGTGFAGSEALATSQTFADGGVKTFKYDIHGDQRRIISVADGRSELYRTIEQTFDKMGRVTQTWNRGTNLKDNYTYDKVGQQLSHWNNVYLSGNREIMDYDAMGRVTSSRAFGGDTTTTTYSWEVSSNTNAVGNFGGWKEHIAVTGIADAKTEWTDIFGRLTRKNDHGNNLYVNVYDVAGRLTSTTKDSASQTYAYYNTGKLKQAHLQDPGVTYSPSVRTTYGYDKVGNLTAQKTWHKGNIVTQNMVATYDALGRLKTWTEYGNQYVLPRATSNYTYDANGNIRRIHGTYRSVYSDQTASTYDAPHDAWYRYDSMNRVVTSKGVLSGNQIVRGTSGRDITYNTAGQRTQVWSTSRESYRYYVNGGGIPNAFAGDYWQEPNYYGGGSSGYWRTVYYDADVREDYTYDNGGNLRDVKSAASTFDGYDYQEISMYVADIDPQEFVNTPGAGKLRGRFNYDALGRVTSQYDYQANGSTVAHSRVVTYNSVHGYVTAETTNTKKGSDTYRSVTTNAYNADNTLSQVNTKNYKNNNDGDAPDTKTINSYRYFDGAVQSSVIYDDDINKSGTFTSSYFYNSFGHLFSSGIYDGQQRDVFFDNTVHGQVIKRNERLANNHSAPAPLQLYYRFGGKEMGRVGNDGTSNVGYEKSVEERQLNTSNSYGPFRNGASTGVGYADFGGDYDAINSYSQGSGGGTYTVRGGENLQAIAMQLWGDASLWYKLAEANGLSGREALIEGRNLVIPSGIQRVHHNAGTVKPYDPAEAIGDTSPTAAKQPKKKKCGVFGAILLAVVAIAVVAVVAGPLSGALANAFAGSTASAAAAGAGVAAQATAIAGGATAAAAASAGAAAAAATLASIAPMAVAAGAVVGGAAAAALGSVISQGIGVATGIQDKFSWKGVGLAAISGGIGGGLGASGLFGSIGNNGAFEAGKLGIKSGIVDAGLRGAVSSGLSQGLGAATGLSNNFSWAGVAAAGAGAAVGYQAGGKLPGLGGDNSLNNHLAHLGTSSASLIANAATRSAIEGSSFGRSVLAAIPDVIANAIFAVATIGVSRPRQMLIESPISADVELEYELVEVDLEEELRTVDAEVSLARQNELNLVSDQSTSEGVQGALPSGEFSTDAELIADYGRHAKKYGVRRYNLRFSDGKSASFNIAGTAEYTETIQSYIRTLSGNRQGRAILRGLAEDGDVTRVFETDKLPQFGTSRSVATRSGLKSGGYGYIAAGTSRLEAPVKFESATGRVSTSGMFDPLYAFAHELVHAWDDTAYFKSPVPYPRHSKLEPINSSASREIIALRITNNMRVLGGAGYIRAEYNGILGIVDTYEDASRRAELIKWKD